MNTNECYKIRFNYALFRRDNALIKRVLMLVSDPIYIILSDPFRFLKILLIILV